MPDFFYFLLALTSVTGFLLIEVIARINRRSIQRGIADYLALKSSGKRIA